MSFDYYHQIPKEYPSKLSIITLNCWGLKYLSKLRGPRLTEIGRQLAYASPPPDIVGLQECWTQADYLSIRKQTEKILPYGKFYFSGMFGGGLAILSKWPIEESTMYQYPLNGRPTAFFRGDWFVGKGVACARIRIGPHPRDIAEVFCTHLHAPYEREPNDSYLCHRTAQAWEIAKLMRGAAERGHLVLGLGDFNMLPLSLAHRVIEAHAPVRDAWRVKYPDSSLGGADYPLEHQRGFPVPTIDYNLKYNGATCDSAANTWRWHKSRQKRLLKGENVDVSHDDADLYAKRLDYIFFSSSASGSSGDASFSSSASSSSSIAAGASSSSASLRKWTLEDIRVGMTQRHPTLNCSLSDHFSVEATLTLNPAGAELSELSSSSAAAHNETPATPSKPKFLEPAVYEDILRNLWQYVQREQWQRRLRLTHLLMAVLITIACWVGVWFVPDIANDYYYDSAAAVGGVSFLLLVVSTLSFAAGVIDGLIGGLFVSSELRALREFEWEVKAVLARARMLGQGGDSAKAAAQRAGHGMYGGGDGGEEEESQQQKPGIMHRIKAVIVGARDGAREASRRYNGTGGTATAGAEGQTGNHTHRAHNVEEATQSQATTIATTTREGEGQGRAAGHEMRAFNASESLAALGPYARTTRVHNSDNHEADEVAATGGAGVARTSSAFAVGNVTKMSVSAVV